MVYNYSMKRITFVIALIIIALMPLTAIEVYKSELQLATNQEIHFKSYVGPVTVYNTMAQIRGIGSDLGNAVANGSFEAGNPNRYYVMHLISEDTDGLDADVFIIGPNAAVDHIRNLRAIISAYLESAYQYSREDADTLATFITVYNAVYRQNINNFIEKYKELVYSVLDSDIVGLSTDYADWPGNTQIVIPLTGREAGSLSAIDTSVISDQQVVDNIREESDMGVDVRTDMANLKDREADEAFDNAKKAAESAAEAAKDVKDAQKTADDAKTQAKKTEREAVQAKSDAVQAQKAADKDPENEELAEKAKAASEKAVTKAKEAATAAEEAQDAQNKLLEAQQKAKEKADKAAEEQIFADKKRSEAQTDTKEIAKDAAKLPQKDELVSMTYGLKIVDKAKLLSALVIVDNDTGKELKTSAVNVIRGRTVYQAGNQFIAIAGKNEGNGAIRLVLIDGLTLEMTKQSDEPVSENAVLVSHGGFFYTVIQRDKAWVLGKYSKDLELVAETPFSVLETTPIFIKDNSISVVDSQNRIHVLAAETLGK